MGTSMGQTERGVTRESIVEAALQIADMYGVEPLTMRRLADAVGVGLATLYGQVRSREDVLDGIAQRLIAEADVSVHTGEPWQETIRRNARSYHGIAKRHPRTFHLLALRRNDDPAVLAHVASVLALFHAAGFSEEQAFLVNAVTDAFNSGFSLVAAQGLAAEAEDTGEDPHAALLSPPLRLKLAEMTSDDTFELGLDTVIAGIAATTPPAG
jgi:AcrR family transcriptional regulator